LRHVHVTVGRHVGKKVSPLAWTHTRYTCLYWAYIWTQAYTYAKRAVFRVVWPAYKCLKCHRIVWRIAFSHVSSYTVL